MSEIEFVMANVYCHGHKYNETFLRENEPVCLIHSTPLSNWESIRRDGILKSWNYLKSERCVYEDKPIGLQLGDPIDFSDYIMFGGGTTGEIVVNSKQQGKIVMDENAEYLTGARLYFNAEKWQMTACLFAMAVI